MLWPVMLLDTWQSVHHHGGVIDPIKLSTCCILACLGLQAAVQQCRCLRLPELLMHSS